MKLRNNRKHLGRSWAVTLIVIAVVLSPLAIDSPSGADLTWTNARPAVFASGVQNAAPYADFTSTSCSALNCVAAGTFRDASSDYVAMTETSSDGGLTWGSVLSPPVSRVASLSIRRPPDSFFNAVSCSGSICVAAGYFINADSFDQAMTATSSDAGVTWTVRPVNIANDMQSATLPGSQFYSVSCTGSTCVAAVAYYDTLNTSVAMTETSSDGALDGRRCKRRTSPSVCRTRRRPSVTSSPCHVRVRPASPRGRLTTSPVTVRP